MRGAADLRATAASDLFGKNFQEGVCKDREERSLGTEREGGYDSLGSGIEGREAKIQDCWRREEYCESGRKDWGAVVRFYRPDSIDKSRGQGWCPAVKLVVTTQTDIRRVM